MAGEVLKTTALLTSNTFSSRFESGHIAFMGGDAPKPTELVVAALAGCSGLTFRGMLDKMQVACAKIEVEVEGERREERPTSFCRFKVRYHVWGKDLDASKLEKAMELTEAYCPVLQTLIKAGPVESSVVIEK